MHSLISLLSGLFSVRRASDPLADQLKAAARNQEEIDQLAVRRYHGWAVYLAWERRRLQRIVARVDTEAPDTDGSSILQDDARRFLAELDTDFDASLSLASDLPLQPDLTTKIGSGHVVASSDDDFAALAANPTNEDK